MGSACVFQAPDIALISVIFWETCDTSCCKEGTSLPLGIEDGLLNNHLTPGNCPPIKTETENWRRVKITKGKKVLDK